ncbi:MAG: hypothetical protein M1816_001124 [Peltula sp. TS41687]|nr:MAG: hypothetical protein M1816_001124 [Peltula sp. TS41687]
MHFGRLVTLILAPLSVIGAPLPDKEDSSNEWGVPNGLVPFLLVMGIPVGIFMAVALSGFQIQIRTSSVTTTGDPVVSMVANRQGKGVALTKVQNNRYVWTGAWCTVERHRILQHTSPAARARVLEHLGIVPPHDDEEAIGKAISDECKNEVLDSIERVQQQGLDVDQIG